ncbi:uncharacterized protein LOC106012453 [Aplysia californica]|uniref:Uncharacterized protein LOC106012453 n=1 Tax=Aplysia californica TaxID=6500 RepID=A0ABM1A4Y6_APLCA|nr:uncharacterized protein LOC106012453 [Aplysia californica]
MKLLAVLLVALPCALAGNICCFPDRLSGFVFDSTTGIASSYELDFVAKKNLIRPLIAAISDSGAFALVDFSNNKTYSSGGSVCVETALPYPEVYEQCIPDSATLVSEAIIGPTVGGVPYKAYKYTVGPNTLSIAVTSGCVPVTTRIVGPIAPQSRTNLYVNVTTPASIDFSGVDISSCTSVGQSPVVG